MTHCNRVMILTQNSAQLTLFKSEIDPSIDMIILEVIALHLI